jgi:hypothetical protein
MTKRPQGCLVIFFSTLTQVHNNYARRALAKPDI